MPDDAELGQSKRTFSVRLPLVAAALILFAAVAGAKFFLFAKPFRYAGTLEATKVDLSSRISSSILAVKVNEGEQVVAGQEMVNFLCDDLKVTNDLATINYERNLKLFKAGAISPETMDQVRNRKEDIDVRISWCTIRSPIQGTVLNRYHEPGEWVTPGTKLLTIANIKDIWTYIYVPQTTLAQWKPGQKLSGFLPELGDKVFSGTILKINSEAEFTPKNVQTQAERSRLVFGVKVSFQESNKDEVLKPGMTIEVALPIDGPKD